MEKGPVHTHHNRRKENTSSTREEKKKEKLDNMNRKKITDKNELTNKIKNGKRKIQEIYFSLRMEILFKFFFSFHSFL